MRAGTERNQLLQVAAGLEIELGYRAVDHGTAAATGGIARQNFSEMLSDEDVHLVDAITGALARVASAVSRAHQVADSPNAVEGAIDGAEMVMWGELVRGHGPGRLASMLPGFVFLVVLPLIGREEALGLSRRTEELVASQA